MRATTGAAPVPVPPPSPAVTKTMSEPRSAALSWSSGLLGRRAPDAGSAPEPSPCVTPSPMRIFVGASEIASAWTSVLTATKSTCAMPGVHHAVERVQAGAADADDADRRDVRSALRRRHAVQPRRRLEHRLEVASRGPRRGRLGR